MVPLIRLRRASPTLSITAAAVTVLVVLRLVPISDSNLTNLSIVRTWAFEPGDSLMWFGNLQNLCQESQAPDGHALSPSYVELYDLMYSSDCAVAQAAFAANPSFHRRSLSYFWRGIIQLRLGGTRIAPTKKIWQEAGLLDEMAHQYTLQYGLYSGKGESRLAREALELAAKIGENGAIFRKLADVHIYQTHRTELARQALLMAAQYVSTEEERSYLLGREAMLREDWNNARSYLARATSSGPDAALAWHYSGVADAEMGNDRSAVFAWRRAYYSLNRDDPFRYWPALRMANALKAEGKLCSAFAWSVRALEYRTGDEGATRLMSSLSECDALLRRTELTPGFPVISKTAP